MKKIVILLSSLVAFYSFSQGNFKFIEETHDFGKVPEGDSVSYEFEFTNVGDQPIKISNVQPSCGCTVPKWPSEAIQPGAKGKILAKYATKSRVGVFNKTMTITSDGIEATKQIFFKGEVIAATPTTESVVEKTVPAEKKKETPKTNVPNGDKKVVAKKPTGKKVSSNASPKATDNKGTAKKTGDKK